MYDSAEHEATRVATWKVERMVGHVDGCLAVKLSSYFIRGKEKRWWVGSRERKDDDENPSLYRFWDVGRVCLVYRLYQPRS